MRANKLKSGRYRDSPGLVLHDAGASISYAEWCCTLLKEQVCCLKVHLDSQLFLGSSSQDDICSVLAGAPPVTILGLCGR